MNHSLTSPQQTNFSSSIIATALSARCEAEFGRKRWALFPPDDCDSLDSINTVSLAIALIEKKEKKKLSLSGYANGFEKRVAITCGSKSSLDLRRRQFSFQSGCTIWPVGPIHPGG